MVRIQKKEPGTPELLDQKQLRGSARKLLNWYQVEIKLNRNACGNTESKLPHEGGNMKSDRITRERGKHCLIAGTKNQVRLCFGGQEHGVAHRS